MASKGKPVARATVQIGGDDAQLRRVLRRLRRRMSGFFKKLVASAKRTGKALAAGLTAGLISAVTLATRYEAVLTRVIGTFGELSDEAEEFSRSLAARLGTDTRSILSMVQKVGQEFRSMGFDVETALQLTTRLVDRAEVLGDALDIDGSSIIEAVRAASQGRLGSLQRLGLGISRDDLQQIRDAQGLDLDTTSGQMQMMVRILEQLEGGLTSNIQELVDAQAAGENASQRLSRVYGQVRDQLREFGTNLLPAFSGILARFSTFLRDATAIFEAEGLRGVVRDFLEAARPFTDVLVAGIQGAAMFMVGLLRLEFDKISFDLANAIARVIPGVSGIPERFRPGTSGRQMDRLREESMEPLSNALEALDATVKDWIAEADARAKEDRLQHEERMSSDRMTAEQLEASIRGVLGDGRAQVQSILSSLGTFSVRAANLMGSGPARTLESQMARTNQEILRENRDQNRTLERIERNTKASSVVQVNQFVQNTTAFPEFS